MNKIFLSGNLTADCETKYSSNETAYFKNAIAVQRGYGKDSATDFFNITAFDKIAEFMGKYLKKGTRITIEGHVQTSEYEKDGEKRIGYNVLIDKVETARESMSNEKKSNAPTKKQPDTQTKRQPSRNSRRYDDEDFDNLPFD